MIDYSGFRKWLSVNTSYSERTISNIVSRLKRADAILPWFDEDIYLFRLEQSDAFMSLNCSIKSQLRKAAKLYYEYNCRKEKEHI